ncbi:MAG: TAXI family TRAP transporter solute-binding subunit [Alphaproteobacteria bacterium]|nr:TAXI family TRAP transporter solute-binding subunit [Alphaproteobacteria bacterium]
MRDFMRVYGPLILVVIVGLAIALFFVDPPPPKKVTIAGGAAGGAYAITAQHLADALKKEHIEASVRTTAGSVENLDLLKSGKADIGIVQTGLAGDLGYGGVRSLGALFYEPLWVAYRAGLPVADLRDLKGRKVAVGPEGSGVRVLATLLLSRTGLMAGDYDAIPLGGANAAMALRKGEVDAALLVTGATADWIHDLAGDPAVRLLSMRRSGALSRRFPYLDQVTLYEGVLDLARDIPDHDVQLISPVAQVAVREGLHPAIQSLLIEAAFAEAGGGSMLSAPGAFPDPKLADIPISSEARRYYKNGASFLRRIFPFSVANFLERAWVLVIPLITLLFPVVRAAPPLYRWRIRRKIYIWYQDLRELENEGRAATTAEQRHTIRGKLADMQAETGHVQVPLSYTDDLYRLRSHISFVAELIEKLSAEDKYERV